MAMAGGEVLAERGMGQGVLRLSVGSGQPGQQDRSVCHAVDGEQKRLGVTGAGCYRGQREPVTAR